MQASASVLFCGRNKRNYSHRCNRSSFRMTSKRCCGLVYKRQRVEADDHVVRGMCISSHILRFRKTSFSGRAVDQPLAGVGTRSSLVNIFTPADPLTQTWPSYNFSHDPVFVTGSPQEIDTISSEYAEMGSICLRQIPVLTLLLPLILNKTSSCHLHSEVLSPNG